MTKTTLDEDVQATLERLEEKDRGLKQFLKKAYGYAVFPSVGKAALVVGGSYGRGEVFERGKMIGMATVAQTTIGVQVGGETYSQIIAFESKETLDRFKKGKLAFAANASAVLVKAGAAAAANYEKGAVVFVYAEGGMLLELSIGGQKFKFKPVDGAAGSKQASGRGQEEEQSDEGQDEDEQGGDEQEASGSAGGGVMEKLQSATSKIGDFVSEHPVAATLVGTGLAAGAAWMIVRTLRRSSEEGDQGDDQDSGEDSYDEESADQAEDQAGDQDSEDEQDDQEEDDEQPRRSRNNTHGGRMMRSGRRG